MSKIFEHRGDILDVQDGIIIHGCNNKGVMGSGIAKAIREKYPQVFRDYSNLITSGYGSSARMGKLAVTLVTPHRLYIANAITQNEYGTDKTKVYVDYPAIERAFSEVSNYCTAYNLDLHFPLIGCGLANGDWDKVSSIIESVVPTKVRKHLWVLP